MSDIPALETRFTRAQLVRYAGASGDLNPIHFSDHAAVSLGLDGVLAHGMLTMGVAMRVATDWAMDPARVLDCSFRFSKPLGVPDDAEGAALTVRATATDTGEGPIELALVATSGETVIGKGRARIRRG